MVEGYVLHAYGPVGFVRQAVAAAVTLRRHDTRRPIALYAPPEHLDLLVAEGLDSLFDTLDVLPEEHRSIVGFKLHLDRFMPFDRCLFLDADMVWCRDPDPLWRQLSSYGVTATGLERADFWFGGPKGPGILLDYLLDRRRRTMRRFGLTYLPRIQAGMLFASDLRLASDVCATARAYLARRRETHFRSRLGEGRSEESCEWSLAMALSAHDLPVLPWFQGQLSPQLDFVPGLVQHDPDFERVSCTYYCKRSVHALRGLPSAPLRRLLLGLSRRLPGRGDYMFVTPFALHFGWLRFKRPYLDLADRIWEKTVRENSVAAPSGNGVRYEPEPASAR